MPPTIELTQLWLPILVSTIAVFVASSIIWMALPIHKKDYAPLGANEPKTLDFIRFLNLAPGLYNFPACEHGKGMKDPAVMERMKTGPIGQLLVMPPGFNMGKTMGIWMLNLLIMATLVGYVCTLAVPAGAECMHVFRVACTAAFMVHGGSILTDSIWKGRPWKNLPGAIFDAVVYSLITAGAFCWLWPKTITL